jgi:hypothetical protein
MTTESKKITITEALSQLRLIDKKIAKATEEQDFFISETPNGVQISLRRVKDVETAKRDIVSSFDRLTSLMATRMKLKRGIVQSNAVTKVTIGKDTMTVAEAVETKKVSIEARTELLGQAMRHIKAQERLVAKTEERILASIESKVSLILGNQKNVTKDNDTIATIEAQVRKAEGVVYHDPLNAHEFAKNLSEEIQDFLANVDVILTVSNSTTYIEV